MLRMLLESRIINLFDLWFLLQPARDLEGVLAMPLHPKRQGLQSTEREKAGERPRDRAPGVLQKRDLIAELLVFPDDNDAANHVGMAVEIFRRGMNDHVEPELDRTLHPGTGKGVVGNADCLVRLRDFRDGLEID